MARPKEKQFKKTKRPTWETKNKLMPKDKIFIQIIAKYINHIFSTTNQHT